MNKVHTSAIVIIPPKEKWESIQEIRKIYDRNINRWMPHITLLYPFYPKNMITNIEKGFMRLGYEFNVFTLSLREFRYFKHRSKNYTLWLDPIPNDSIIKLQEELLKIVPECNDVNKYKGGFKPHLSVGQFKGKLINLKTNLEKIQNNWEEVKFEVKEFCYIWRENVKNSSFQIEKLYPLKG